MLISLEPDQAADDHGVAVLQQRTDGRHLQLTPHLDGGRQRDALVAEDAHGRELIRVLREDRKHPGEVGRYLMLHLQPVDPQRTVELGQHDGTELGSVQQCSVAHPGQFTDSDEAEIREHLLGGTSDVELINRLVQRELGQRCEEDGRTPPQELRVGLHAQMHDRFTITLLARQLQLGLTTLLLLGLASLGGRSSLRLRRRLLATLLLVTVLRHHMLPSGGSRINSDLITI